MPRKMHTALNQFSYDDMKYEYAKRPRKIDAFLETTNHLLFLRFYNNGYFKGVLGQMFPMSFSFLMRRKI